MFGLCLKNYQPLFVLNIMVEKTRKRNSRKHDFSNKEFYSFQTGKLRAPLPETPQNKNLLSFSSLHKPLFYLKVFFSLHSRTIVRCKWGKPVLFRENKKQTKILDSSLFLLVCDLKEVTSIFTDPELPYI